MKIVTFNEELNYYTESGLMDGNRLYKFEAECIDLCLNHLRNVDMDMFRANLIEPAMLYSDYKGPSIIEYFDKSLANIRQINNDNTNIRTI